LPEKPPSSTAESIGAQALILTGAARWHRSRDMNQSFDIAVIGAGIVGLAHAWAAAKSGKRVVVFDRDTQSNGASVRNFGLISVTGQRGVQWQRAQRTRDIWLDIAQQTGIVVDQRGMVITARRPEAKRVLEAFAAGSYGEGTELMTPDRAAGRIKTLKTDEMLAALWSPHELRVESRLALPRLARWLTERFGVEFRKGTLVKAVEPPRIETTTGVVRAEAAIVCPGDEFQSLFADRIAHYKLTRCKVQMLRIKPARRVTLGASVMSELSLLRYPAFTELADASRLKARIDAEQREINENNINLIAVQSADGSIVVGDSQHYGPTDDGIGHEHIDRIILSELDTVLDLPGRQISERWTGSYAYTADRPMIVDRPNDQVRLVMITSGSGASTAFAIAEEVVGDLIGSGATSGRKRLAA
jgi:FAD dependent oxidoreductase TIGR03364